MFRQCVEAAVYLALAVVLFRTFLVEGYMISTGSMAPCLNGYHRQIVCPSCSYAYSRGIRFDDGSTLLAAGSRAPVSDLGGDAAAPETICPNCGLSAIDISVVPRNEGDQLLVQKHLYQLRSPRRWEVVVFRHPDDTAQAYVKRVVGLPGERIELADGDVYANGVVQRKLLATQRSMRLVVFDQDHEPMDADWQARWRIPPGSSAWSANDGGFIYCSPNDSESPDSDVDWLTYHHWIREGGTHRTAVEPGALPADVPANFTLDGRVVCNSDTGRVECRGVMTTQDARRLRRLSDDSAWASAIAELERRSHEGPIVDQYGYNDPEAGDGPYAVHDLMLEAVIRRVRGPGRCQLRMTDGWHQFDAVFDLGDQRVRLYVDQAAEPIRDAELPEDAFTTEATVEMSLFDRQVLVAIDGDLACDPLAYAAEERPREASTCPVQLGAAGLDIDVSHLRLYRDVYYTPKHVMGRVDAARLGPDEYFMLGDNSPVSVDSRTWDSPAIPRDLLIGKPFLVHLPSQQGKVEIGGRVHHIRIPDFSRVRYIR